MFSAEVGTMEASVTAAMNLSAIGASCRAVSQRAVHSGIVTLMSVSFTRSEAELCRLYGGSG